MLNSLLAAVLSLSGFALSTDPNVSILADSSHLETAVAASGSHVVVSAIRDVSSDQPAWIDTWVSDDAGNTWSAPIEMPTTIGGVDYAYEADPWLTTFDDGSFGLVYIATKAYPDVRVGTIPQILVFIRSADGHQWSDPQVLLSGPSIVPITVDRPFIFTDVHGTGYVVYTSGLSGSNKIMISSTTDRGAHWTTAKAVTTSKGVSLAQLAVTDSGRMVVTGVIGNDATLVRLYSDDGGANWSDTSVIGTNVAGGNSPANGIASPPMSTLGVWHDHVYVTYPAKDGVYFAQSADRGSTWSTPIRLGGALGDAVLPALTVDPTNGNVTVVWLDGRDDLTHSGTLRLYATRSTDLGNTFETPRPFSSPFGAAHIMGDVDGAATIGRGLSITAFATGDHQLIAARMQFAPPPWHRAARH